MMKEKANKTKKEKKKIKEISIMHSINHSIDFASNHFHIYVPITEDVSKKGYYHTLQKKRIL